MQAIKDHLLKRGGADINVPSEWLDEPTSWKAVMDQIVRRGHEMDSTRVERQTMDVNQCHKNSTTLVLNGEVPSFATGFAPHSDKVWYFHSWRIRNSCYGEVIVETHQDTFHKYFGAEYSGESGKAWANGLYSMVTSPAVPYSDALYGSEWQP